MTIPELERSLAAAHERLRQINERLQFRNPGVTLKDHLQAFEDVAAAHRALAAAKGEEHAVSFDIGVEPEAAVSGAVLLQTEDAAVLTFNAMRREPGGPRRDAGRAIVSIEGFSLTKFGYPNDEALPAHPLYHKGLGGYGVYEVINSSWVKLITEQNRVAFPNTPDFTARHFVFTFHDSTFRMHRRRAHRVGQHRPISRCPRAGRRTGHLPGCALIPLCAM